MLPASRRDPKIVATRRPRSSRKVPKGDAQKSSAQPDSILTRFFLYLHESSNYTGIPFPGHLLHRLRYFETIVATQIPTKRASNFFFFFFFSFYFGHKPPPFVFCFCFCFFRHIPALSVSTVHWPCRLREILSWVRFLGFILMYEDYARIFSYRRRSRPYRVVDSATFFTHACHFHLYQTHYQVTSHRCM